MRILITGSRDWNNLTVIQTVLEEIHRDRMFDRSISNPHKRKVILVSGACPNGADKMCEWVAEQIGWQIERHPANWNKYKKRAGFIRNAEMAKLGADVCLAFVSKCAKPTCKERVPHDSHGTAMMIDLAQKAGIETKIWRSY